MTTTAASIILKNVLPDFFPLLTVKEHRYSFALLVFICAKNKKKNERPTTVQTIVFFSVRRKYLNIYD